MEYNYGFIVTPLSEEDGGGFLVQVPDLPGCITDGDTYEEALKKKDEAIESWIMIAKEDGKEIPKPKAYQEDEYSGKITARLPKSLHRDLANLAKKEGVSINQLIVTSCSKEVGRQEILTQKCDKKCERNSVSCKITFEAPDIFMNQIWCKEKNKIDDIPQLDKYRNRKELLN